MVRRLRGLRAQLLLWMVAPLIVVLVVLSLVGVQRHRETMTQLVEERDRGLVLAQANQLAREIARRATLLLEKGNADRSTATDLAADAQLQGAFSGGLARFTAQGELLTATDHATVWAQHPEAAAWIARGIEATPSFLTTTGANPSGELPLLLIGMADASGQVLVGAIPVESLNLEETSAMIEGGAHGAGLYVLDAQGYLIHHHTPSTLHMAASDLQTLAPLLDQDVGVLSWEVHNQSLLVAYAQVDPLDWTMISIEDLRSLDAMAVQSGLQLPLALLLVTVLALLALSFGVARVVRPLQQLAERAARVAWGEYQAVQQPVGGIQEIDDLRATIAQMAERIHSYQTGMRDYLSAVTKAQEEERARLAHELHDDTVQALIALKQQVQMARRSLSQNPDRAAQRLDELSSYIDQELTSLRRLIGDLRPIYLEDLGFLPALQMLTQRWEDQNATNVRLDVDGEPARLAPDLELAAFRIVQEALSNVAAHAQAQTVTIAVRFVVNGLEISIRDDGIGFAPPEQPADLVHAGHFGLMGMRERVLLHGGHLTIESAPGQGVHLLIWLPLAPAAAHAE